MDWVIFDLDGTLADISHRLHFIRSSEEKENFKKDWNSFNSGIPEDKLKLPIAALHKMCFDNGYNIAIVTGRSKDYQVETIKWLMNNQIHFDEIHFRPAGNYHSDYIVKQEIYDKHFKERNVLFVVDDRDQVVEMWRRNGVTCLQCQKGDY